MAHGHYLNLEIALREIVDSEISMMGDTVTLDKPGLETVLDDKAFENNLKHGFVALCTMCDYLECCINAVIRVVYKKPFRRVEPGSDCIWESGESDVKELLRAPIKDKLKRIIEDEKLEKDPRKEHAHLWRKVTQTMIFRNKLLHFKSNYMQESVAPTPGTWHLNGALTPLDTNTKQAQSDESLGRRLTATAMEESWQEIQRLTQAIIENAGCVMRPEAQLIDADAKDGFTASIVRKSDYAKRLPIAKAPNGKNR